MLDEHERYLEKRTLSARSDTRSTHEFISLALTEPEEEDAWDAVVTLHYRGTREVFDAACQLCVSDCPQERGLGADILGQLGVPDRAFPVESSELLTRLLVIEDEESVLCSICSALGHLGVPKSIPTIARLKTHPSDKVRFFVVMGLLGFEEKLAVDSLIELSRDPDADVRNWATFGLGTQVELDTEEIRTALVDRLLDEDLDARGEALVGLARRKDPRVLEPLIDELNGNHPTQFGYSLEAAEELADPRLLPVLKKWKESADPGDDTLDKAILRCSASLTGSIDRLPE
jgi:HEAT repeat protein